MVDLTDLQPPRLETPEERLGRLESEAAAKPSLGDGVGAAIESEWLGSWLLRQAGKEDHDLDPNFRWTDELYNELTEGVPDEHKDYVMDAVSEPHARTLRSRLDEVMENERTLSSMGWAGVGLRAGAAILDPAAIGITLATEGMAAPLIWGSKISRLSRAIRAGVVAGGTNAGIEGILATDDPTRDWKDVLYAGAAGVALGGAFGLAIPGKSMPELEEPARKLMKEIERSDIEELGLGVNSASRYFDDLPKLDDLRVSNDNAGVRYDDGADAAAKVSNDNAGVKFDEGVMARAVNDDLGPPPAANDILAPVDPPDLSKVANQNAPSQLDPLDPEGGSIGAAQNPGYDLPLSPRQQAILDNAKDAPKSAFGKVRIDMVGTLKQSEHPVVRKLAGLLAEDGVGNADGSAMVRAASENVSRMNRVEMSDFYKTALPEFKEWSKIRGATALNRDSLREDYFSQVGKAMRRPRGEYTDDPHINRLADQLRDKHKKLLQFAKEKGIRGFDEVDENDNYLMRVWNNKTLDNLVAKYKPQEVWRLVGGALMRGSEGITPDEAMKIAKAVVSSVQRRKFGTDIEASRIFSGSQAEQLRQVLKDDGELSDMDIDRIVGTVTEQGDGKHARAKHRLSFDETYWRMLHNPETQVRERVDLESLFESNAENLFHIYTRQIAGAGFMQDALKKFALPKMGDDGVETLETPTWETVKKQIIDTADIVGSKPEKLATEMSKLDVLMKAVMGMPLHGKVTNLGETMRMVRDYQFTRVMNQVGFAQIAEIGNILMQAGFRSSLQHLPALRQIYSRAQNGQLNNQLLNEIEAIWGFGTDRLRNQTTNRFDDYGVMEYRGGVGKVDKLLQKGKRITADVSLLAPINMALQRMAGSVVVQRFTDLAYSGKPMSSRRLASLGIDEENGRRVQEQIRKHVTVGNGIVGHKVKQINLDSWDDQEAAALFVNAVDRWSRRMIQENDIGQMSKWMTTETGKTIIQFRSFMTAAWTKQLLWGLHSRDFATFSSWSLGMLIGGLTYMGQTHLNAIGRDDREAYLKKRLSMEAIGASAFQRAGFASVIPGALDTVIGLGGADPIFAYGRTTGLATDAFFGNPTLDFVNNAQKGIRGAVAPALSDDYQYSKQDAYAQASTLAFQNMLGIKNVYSALSADLPRQSDTSR